MKKLTNSSQQKNYSSKPNTASTSSTLWAVYFMIGMTVIGIVVVSLTQ